MLWYDVCNLKGYLNILEDQLPPLDNYDTSDTKNRRLMLVSEALDLISYIKTDKFVPPKLTYIREEEATKLFNKTDEKPD